MTDTRRQYPLYAWRFWFLGGVLLLGFVALMARAAYLQTINTSFLQQQSDSRALRDLPITSYRGTITDRHGEELAVSIEVESVFLDPKEIIEKHDPEGMRKGKAWNQLAVVLFGKKPRELNKLVDANANRQFVWAKRQLAPEEAELVRMLNLPGVHLVREFRRYYPHGEISAHVVGFTDIDERGIEGIERAFDKELTAAHGAERKIMDRRRRVVEDHGVIKKAQPGQDITLAIDSRIQTIAYQELKKSVREHRARSGSIVILDVHTGEVLAMVNQPSYNPNKRQDRPLGATRNRAITDTFEPGSTAKPITVVSALESGLYKPKSIIDTRPGYMRVGGSWVRDDGHNYGVLDLAGVIRKSSNVGVAQMALAMPKEHFLGTFQRLGFGVPINTGFPGESPGRLILEKRWSKFELATVSYGYGFTTTPLQLARAYATLAGGGIQKPVSFLKVRDGVVGQQVLDEQIAKSVLNMMEEVTTDGTGKLAQVQGYRVSGKTGTIRKATAGGYSSDYQAVFAGVAPVKNPRLVMVAMIDEPAGDRYYGGNVAAPVFSVVMDQALRLINVTPDGEAQKFVQTGREANDV